MMEKAICSKCNYIVVAYTLPGLITKVKKQGGSLKYNRCPCCERYTFKMDMKREDNNE